MNLTAGFPATALASFVVASVLIFTAISVLSSAVMVSVNSVR